MSEGRQTGSDRMRSKTPFLMSLLIVMAVYIVIMTTVCTRMPGARYSRYWPVEPAIAPPKM